MDRYLTNFTVALFFLDKNTILTYIFRETSLYIFFFVNFLLILIAYPMKNKYSIMKPIIVANLFSL